MWQNAQPTFRSTATGHAGQLVCGRLDGVPVMVMEGRMHAYEGYPLAQITFPVRVLERLGAILLVVTNACGGLNPQYRTGDLMIIDDHVNLMNDNPLVGINDDRLGPRFPDMSEPYDRSLVSLARKVAKEKKIPVRQGVFVAGAALKVGPGRGLQALLGVALVVGQVEGVGGDGLQAVVGRIVGHGGWHRQATSSPEGGILRPSSMAFTRFSCWCRLVSHTPPRCREIRPNRLQASVVWTCSSVSEPQ